MAAISLAHLLVAGRTELSGDESHYALYGYFLDWSYFDHPPLVGWLQALILPWSDSVFALRLWPVVLGALTSLTLFRLTRLLFPDDGPWGAWVAVALLQSALAFQALSLALLPDSVLLPLGLAAAAVLYRAAEQGRERHWLWVGLLFGLAGLAKYTAVTLAASAVLVVLVGQRGQLRRPWPWLAVAIAAAAILPVLVWNGQHDWISFRYQLGHGVPGRRWELGRFALSQAGQLVAYGPLLYLLGIAAIVGGLRRWREPAVRFVLLLALPALLLFVWSSGLEPTLPHWTLFGWALLTPLIAHWLLGAWQRRWVRVVAWLGGGYALLLALLLHSALFTPWLPFQPLRYPFADLYGWQAATARAEQLRLAMEATAGPKPLLFAGNWSYASHIAWYARPVPVQVTDDTVGQSDLWYGSPAVGARGVMVVPLSQFSEGDVARWLGRFAHCEKADEVDYLIGGQAAVGYGLYRCEGYRG